MPLHIEIPDDLARELTERAAAFHGKPEQVALNAIRRSLASDRKLSELLAPVHEAFRESGMTEDEAVELFEAEKHAMRRGDEVQASSSSTRNFTRGCQVFFAAAPSGLNLARFDSRGSRPWLCAVAPPGLSGMPVW